MSGDKDDSNDKALAESFGKCVSSHREKLGISMAALAESAGMARHALWRIEHGEVAPSLRTIARLAVALGISVSTLVEDVDVSGIALESRPYSKNDKPIA